MGGSEATAEAVFKGDVASGDADDGDEEEDGDDDDDDDEAAADEAASEWDGAEPPVEAPGLVGEAKLKGWEGESN